MNGEDKGQWIALVAILLIVAAGALGVAVEPMIQIIHAVQGR